MNRGQLNQANSHYYNVQVAGTMTRGDWFERHARALLDEVLRLKELTRKKLTDDGIQEAIDEWLATVSRGDIEFRQLKALLERGLTRDEAAEVMGITTRTIYRKLQQAGGGL